MKYRSIWLLGVLLLSSLLGLQACGSQTAQVVPSPLPVEATPTPLPESDPALPSDASPVPSPLDHDGTLQLDATASGQAIDARLFGTNVPAWLNPSGLADPTLIERTITAGTTVIRMPGGSWSNHYDWLGCQLGDEANCYWTWAAQPIHFLELLSRVDQEGMWTINFNGTSQEAAALVAFFNAMPDDSREIGVDRRGRDWKTVGHWAQLRAELGYPEPVPIKLWEIGNEIYGGKEDVGKGCTPWGWEEGGWTCDGTEYVLGRGEGAERDEGFLDFRNAMQAVDPTILVGAVGVPFQDDWNNWGNDVIAAAGDAMDFYVVHQYPYYEPPSSIQEPLAEPQQTWQAIVADVHAAFDRYAGGRRVPIAVTEYNLFSFQDFDTERWMTRAINMLHLADTIGQMAVHGVAMGNQWNLANGETDSFGNYGLLDAGSLERYPQYYVFPLWTNFGNTLLPIESSFDPATTLSVYAGRKDENTLTLLVINKQGQAQRALIALDGVAEVTGARVDVAAADSLDAMQVRWNGVADPANDLSDAPPTELTGVSSRFIYAFAPYSVSLLQIDIQP
ncbi:alpha-L-arabinofuranosidase [Candidatus Chloroploca sp. M-50]|uniref:Alpha-L-arabinofuranosidase n=1 Tax=Candidatus Chloroploca mongolica TaxID=2528176 RepID=A0ABS4DBQ7_9CHLR|nr:alpha-L-arabinofuranosidase [Candidatus Chloroploca mongolica]MBP1466887.1 alpha-L-arabinofuranosidase [Candidatus Chloroploca mongolica]